MPALAGVAGTDKTAAILHAMLSSKATVLVLVNLGWNVFVLVSLLTKSVFFGRLSYMETQKLAERLINYILFKTFFLTAVVEFESTEIALWMAWFALLGYLKMFTGLAKDRFERLHKTPAASQWMHGKTLMVLILVLVSDAAWVQVCVTVFKGAGISNILLLLFEAVIIALDTIQTLTQYVVHLSESWDVPIFSKQTPEWRLGFLYHTNLLAEVMLQLLTLAHYVHVWCLHGIAFQLIDAVLLLNIRAILSSLMKKLSAFLAYRAATRNLREAFPDATEAQLAECNDDCAICKEPMYTAKQLPCRHLFHLSCLRSWFDQGSDDSYTCPTCRTSLSGKYKSSSSAARAAAESVLVERHQQEALFQARAVNRYQEELARLRGRAGGQASVAARQAVGGAAGQGNGRPAEIMEGPDAGADDLSNESGYGGVGSQQDAGPASVAGTGFRDEPSPLNGAPDLYRTAGGQLLSDAGEGLNVGRLLAGIGLAGARRRWQWPLSQNDGDSQLHGPGASTLPRDRWTDRRSQPSNAVRSGASRSGEFNWDFGQAGPSFASESRSGRRNDVSREAALLREQSATARRTRAAGNGEPEVSTRLAEMVATVRGVLPDVPEQAVLRELRRTNSVGAAINNLIDA
ncbi:E3 ubiquitin protein ligase [Klebsormidium nitens]|uniref:E3 ubiquitin protein ligase n=1 Tax=Klebsormidium nitens TaxID=105231 RepID=A0A1Y1IMW9_KLENI|nr:E3 ubiquitin protein ligase [Klebsormidium nitens]|eukprot:GAQ90106.1 E3 ubiquitin protein ligase [Klebsormidium nitens]